MLSAGRRGRVRLPRQRRPRSMALKGSTASLVRVPEPQVDVLTTEEDEEDVGQRPA